MQVLLLAEPLPAGDDDVPLDSHGPLRCRMRQFTLRDAVGPVRIILEGTPPKRPASWFTIVSPD